MRVFLGSLVVLAASGSSAARADEAEIEFGKKPFVVKGIECEVLIPNGWRAAQDRTGMIARAGNSSGPGFRITRQPMLHLPKTFEQQWKAELVNANKLDVKVTTTRVGRYKGWKATWVAAEGGGREIVVLRAHAPEAEMVYNISFSFPRGDASAKLVVKGVQRSFRCTAGKAKMEFERTPLLAGRYTIRMPRGFDVSPKNQLWEYIYRKTNAGYRPPRVTAEIKFGESNPLAQGSPRDAISRVWQQETQGLTNIEGGKSRSAKLSSIKGVAMTGTAMANDSTQKEIFVFVGKLNRTPFCMSIIADAREARLYRHYFKEICSQLKTTR